MKLYARPVSPYTRKVRVAAMETGADALFETFMMTPEELLARVPPLNPLGKIPVLELDDGSALFDSPVICEYLDTLHGGPRLYPESAARWPALWLLALGDGITDAGLELNGERRIRPAALQWSGAVDRQSLKVRRGFDTLEANIDRLSGPLTIGHIAVACAIGYIAFRHPDFAVTATSHPRLHAWYANFAERPSMRATEPYEQ